MISFLLSKLAFGNSFPFISSLMGIQLAFKIFVLKFDFLEAAQPMSNKMKKNNDSCFKTEVLIC